MNNVLVKRQAAALEKIKWLLNVENKAPSTTNELYLADYREKFLNSYRQARLPMESIGPIARDPYDQALCYMASTRAYFQGSHRSLSSTSGGLFTILLVGFKRFTDMVPIAIDEELLRGLDWDRGLYSTLTGGLGITGPGSLDKAKEYLQERPDIKSRRENLQKKLERLQSAKRELQSI